MNKPVSPEGIDADGGDTIEVGVPRQGVGFNPVPKEDLAFLGTGPVPAAPYYKEEFFALEREAIFRRTWLLIGRTSEVANPGDFIVRPIEIANASILISHGKDGQIRAFHNVCAHRGTQLVWEDAGRANSFSCRYHMWNYGQDGALRSVPDIENFYDLDKAKCGLKPVAIDVCEGFMFVNLAPEPAQSLAAFLGPLAVKWKALNLGRYTRFAEYTYEVAANWKSAYDNFQELYHLRWVHEKSLVGKVACEANPYGYSDKYNFYGPHRSMGLWFNQGYEPTATERAFGEGLSRSVIDETTTPMGGEYFGVYPNVFLNSLRGRCFTQQLIPLQAGKTRAIIRIYWDDDDSSAAMRFAREFSLAVGIEVHAEDRDIIERNFAGLSSGAFDEIIFQSQEMMCRHFNKQVTEAVDAYREEQRAEGDL